jgi:hypothetical protein
VGASKKMEQGEGLAGLVPLKIGVILISRKLASSIKILTEICPGVCTLKLFTVVSKREGISCCCVCLVLLAASALKSKERSLPLGWSLVRCSTRVGFSIKILTEIFVQRFVL